MEIEGKKVPLPWVTEQLSPKKALDFGSMTSRLKFSPSPYEATTLRVIQS